MVDGAGKRLIPGVIFNAGQAVPTQKSGKLLLTLGNNSVQIKANGKTVHVPSSAASIGLEFTPRGTKPLAAAHQPRCGMTGRPRAGILVTGTEVLTGIITDRNGPWLSERLREIGVDAAMIQIVGDRPEDLLSALQYMARAGSR